MYAVKIAGSEELTQQLKQKRRSWPGAPDSSSYYNSSSGI